MQLRVLERITDVAPDVWDALLPPGTIPFVAHGHLALLELSGTVGAAVKLEPRHLTLWDGDRLVGAVPAYLNFSNHFDLVPDWAAEIARKHDLAYYPTLCVCLPLATVPSPRFLFAPDVDRAAGMAMLLAGAREVASVSAYPSVHVWGCTDLEAEELARLGFSPRTRPYYAWRNDGYTSFDDFLARLHQERRYSIRKDRRKVAEAGVSVRTIVGADLTDELMDLMWQGTVRNVEKYGHDRSSYTEAFFKMAPELFGAHLELYVAERGGTPFATCLAVASTTGLYPKFWGAVEEVKYAHFEVTWYHPFTEAIARGLPLVDGAGISEHKILRGFGPVGSIQMPTWFADEELQEAYSRLVAKERIKRDEEVAAIVARSPFNK